MLVELIIGVVFFKGLEEGTLLSVRTSLNNYRLMISEKISERNKKHINSREIEELTKGQSSDQLMIDEIIDQALDKLMNDIPTNIPNDTENPHQKKHNKNDKIIEELINKVNSYIKTDVL